MSRSLLFPILSSGILLGGCTLSNNQEDLAEPQTLASLDTEELAFIDEMLTGLEPEDQRELILSADFQELLVELGRQRGPDLRSHQRNEQHSHGSDEFYELRKNRRGESIIDDDLPNLRPQGSSIGWEDITVLAPAQERVAWVRLFKGIHEEMSGQDRVDDRKNSDIAYITLSPDGLDLCLASPDGRCTASATVDTTGRETVSGSFNDLQLLESGENYLRFEATTKTPSLSAIGRILDVSCSMSDEQANVTSTMRESSSTQVSPLACEATWFPFSLTCTSSTNRNFSLTRGSAVAVGWDDVTY